jgi:fumarylacetoacetase
MSALSELHATLDASRKSWVESANAPTHDFPIQNLPFGIFSDRHNDARRLGVAIGDETVDRQARTISRRTAGAGSAAVPASHGVGLQ